MGPASGGDGVEQCRRGRLGAPLSALAAAAILVVLAGTLFSAGAQAEVLLSNNLQENADEDPSPVLPLAQAFTTGPDVRGYALESIELRVSTANNMIMNHPRVTVNQASESNPGAVLYTLNASRSDFTSTGTKQFEATKGTKLEPSTTYFVVIDGRGALGSDVVRIRATASDDEDSATQAGWSVGDTMLSYSLAVWFVPRSEFALEMTVRGGVFNTPPNIQGSHFHRYYPNLREVNGAFNIGAPMSSESRAPDPEGDAIASWSIENLNATWGRSRTPPYQRGCSGNSCVDGVFAIDSSNGQIKTVSGKTYRLGRYRVKVTLTDARGETGHVYVTIDSTSTPGRPRNLFATVTGDNAVQLNWDPPANENRDVPITGYHIQWAAHAGASRSLNVLVENTGNTETSYTHRVQLHSDGRIFGYRVRAINRLGKGLPSEFVKVTQGRDTVGPQAREARLGSDGRTLEISFDEPIDKTNLPDADVFTVTVNGAEAALSPTIGESDYRHRLRLTLARAVRSEHSVSVSYDAPSSANAIRDLNGNRATDFTLEAVNNSEFGPSSPGIGPSPVSGEVASSGAIIRLTFDEALGVAIPDAMIWRILADGAEVAFLSGGRIVATPNIASMVVDPPIRQGQTVTISYTDPNPGTDDTFGVLEDTDGNDVESFADFPVTNNSEVQNAPPEPLTARFGDLPTRHTGEAFTFELEFGEEFPLTAQTLTSALGVTGGSVTAAEKVNEESSRNWRVTVTPSSAAEAVSVTLAPKESCTEEGAICTADGRTIPAPIEAEVPVRAATYITGVEVTSNPGANGVWDTGETVRVQVAFNAQVGVHGPPGSGPTLGIALDGARREAGYTGGSGTTTLTFEHAVTAADAGATRARVVANSLNLNGYVIGDTQGQVAGTYFDGAPELSVADAGGAEGTDAAIAFTVTLAPAAATEVTVHYATADGSATAPADYTSTSSMLTFEPGQTSKTVEVPIADDTEEDDGETFTLVLSDPSGAVLADAEATGTIRDTEAEPVALTAEFLDLPDGGHGANPFTVKLRFSEEFSLSYKTLQDHALGVTNGTLTGVSRVTQGEDRAWNVTVEPSGGGAVTVALAETTDCAAEGAICTADERMLAAVSATVPGTAQAGTPFRVSAGLPAEHDGASEIVFEVSFNKEPQADYSYKTLRDKTLRIRQGGERLTPKVRRLNKPHNDRWEVKVMPGSKEDVTVLIGPFSLCSDEGAVCAADEVLSNRIDRTIEGPPGLSVADARVREAEGATVDFAVTLGRASAETVTVAYATSDGTAAANQDYEPASGTLTFEVGETAKTVAVAVLDDAHDEGEETFTLTLSNPTGNAWLKDATAIGTIENDDPMPQAWLARFGRTIASQAVDAIGGRMEGGGGTHVTVGGQSLSLSGESMAPEDEEDVRGALEALSLTDEPDDTTHGMTGREVMLGSSFRLSAGGEGGGSAFTAWGQFTTGGFEAEVDGTRLDGSVTTGFLGADVDAGRWLAGLALGVSEGEGGYTLIEGGDSGTVESSLTAVYPYARFSLSDKVDVWGLAGYGTGALTLVQNPNTEHAKTYKTDIGMRMGAIGARGEVISPEEPDGLMLALKSDAFWVRTTSEAVRRNDGNLGASEADVNRVRLLVEGSRAFATEGGTLTPSLELGVRQDGGDAETGTGIEAGAGLRYAGGGVTVEGSVRTLVSHEDSGYEEWGASGTVRIDPGPSGRGLSLTLSPVWGNASSGVDRLWSLADTQGLAGESAFEATRRLEAEAGYGLGGPDGLGTVTPYTGLALSDTGERSWRLGARWQVAPSISLNLEGTRGESANDDGPAHGLMLRGVLRL